MLVFIDESGDAGFKMAKGSDPVFAVGMIIFDNAQNADTTRAMISDLHVQLNHKSEFKFSKCDNKVKDAFFTAVRTCPFSVRALVVEKEKIYSDKLRSDNTAFYSFFVKQLMNFDGGVLANAHVRLDGSGGRQFQRALCTYLRRELGNKIHDIKLRDSKRDELVQLADMCIGAIARAYRDRADAARWRNMLKQRIDNVWLYK